MARRGQTMIETQPDVRQDDVGLDVLPPRPPKRATVNGERLAWHCHACGQRVADGSGYLEVDLATAGRHRDAWHRYEAKHSQANGVIISSLADMPDVARAHWRAWHRTCDPRPDANTYWFDVERCDTLGKLIHWAGHLVGKTWIGDTDWSDVLLEIGTDA
jgi:hypothetical protein